MNLAALLLALPSGKRRGNYKGRAPAKARRKQAVYSALHGRMTAKQIAAAAGMEGRNGSNKVHLYMKEFIQEGRVGLEVAPSPAGKVHVYYKKEEADV